MIYREFGKTGWKVSTIGMGTWNIGNQWGEVTELEAIGAVRASYEQGVNLFDTAESYGIPNGISEQRLGTALAGIRHHVYVVSKIGNWGKRTGQGVPKTTPDMIRLCGHASLGRLKTDWLDVVLCHEAEIEDPSVYLEGFELLKKEGDIREYGISTNNLDVLKRFNVNGNCSVVEVDYSLLNQAPEADFLPYCQENGIAVLVRGPLDKGLLSGKYKLDSHFEDPVRKEWNKDGSRRQEFEEKIGKVEKIKSLLGPKEDLVTTALRYVISNHANPVAIPGAKSPVQAIANAAAGNKLMSADELSKFANI